VRNLIDRAGESEKEEIEALIRGESIVKQIHLDITYEEVNNDIAYLWNFLYFTGYLTMVEDLTEQDNKTTLRLEIPNLEVKTIFRNKISDWFDDTYTQQTHTSLYKALLAGDTETMNETITELLQENISYMDSDESFYHGFLLALLVGMRKENYHVESNREKGDGRADIVVCERKTMDPTAAVFEVKKVKDTDALEAGCKAALKQIADNEYDRELKRQKYKTIWRYGVAFCGKECLVETGEKGKN
jgi:cysteinyl-tRNA synthetase